MPIVVFQSCGFGVGETTRAAAGPLTYLSPNASSRLSQALEQRSRTTELSLSFESSRRSLVHNCAQTTSTKARRSNRSRVKLGLRPAMNSVLIGISAMRSWTALQEPESAAAANVKTPWSIIWALGCFFQLVCVASK